MRRHDGTIDSAQQQQQQLETAQCSLVTAALLLLLTTLPEIAALADDVGGRNNRTNGLKNSHFRLSFCPEVSHLHICGIGVQ